MQHHCSRMAHHLGIGFRQDFYAMTGCLELLDKARIKTGFEAQVRTRGSPSAAEEPTRSIDGAVERLAEKSVAGEQRCLRLRLSISSHRAIGNDASVIELGKRRVERVPRKPAGLERIDGIVLERKA